MIIISVYNVRTLLILLSVYVAWVLLKVKIYLLGGRSLVTRGIDKKSNSRSV